MRRRARRLLRGTQSALPTVAVATIAGWGASRTALPLPWMLGPLLGVAALRIAGFSLPSPPAARQLGQWMIGAALGLYFTPAVVGQLAWLVPWILLAGAMAIVVGFVCGHILGRIGRLDFTTAFFASVPGGASEMAVLGERFGARVDRVAAAQSLRILMVVAIIPAIYQAVGVHGVDRYAAGSREFDWAGFLALATMTAAGAALLGRVGVGNAWVIGPLAVAAPITAVGLDLSAIPREVTNVGQVLLGCALASRFQPEFVHTAGRFLLGVAVAVVTGMAMSALFGWGLAAASGIHWTTMILSTAPGGIAEMALTAKVLELGVPIVSAFHITRMVMLVLLTGPLYGWLESRQWWRRR